MTLAKITNVFQMAKPRPIFEFFLQVHFIE